MAGPLAGISIVDLSRAVPGPYCSMLLGDMGADVLLVERIEDARPRDHSADATNALRRNKRSICLDLKSPRGRDIFLRVARDADVVIEGFRPGVMKRLGLHREAIGNDRLVYLSLSGYGQTGPLAYAAGHDLDYVAMGGALSAIGREGSPPAIPLNLVADLAGGGLFAAYAIMLALFARERTGRGQFIDLAMTDGVMSLMARAASQMVERGFAPLPGRDRITGALPHYDVYECSDRRYVAIAPLEDKFRIALYTRLGLDDVSEKDSKEVQEQRRGDLRDIFRRRTRDEWIAAFSDLDACVAPVLALDEALAHPHHRTRGIARTVVDSNGREFPQIGVAPALAETPGGVRRLGVAPGHDTRAVLSELGFQDAEVAELERSHVVA